MVKKGKGFEELEKEDLGGQSLQGPETADQIHKFLDTHGKEVHQAGGFPLLENVWKFCYQVTTLDHACKPCLNQLFFREWRQRS